MTRSDLRTLVLSWLDDSAGGYFTSSQVNTWLNTAQRQVQMELIQAGENWYMKPAETTTVASQADYVLPSDFLVEHRLEVVLDGTGVNENRQPLKPITTNQQDGISIQLAPPTNYYIKKDRVTLSPTPDKAYTLRIYYSPIISDMGSDSDSPDVPPQFHEYVALLAAFNGFIKDDRVPNTLLAKEEEFLKLLKQMSVERTQDQSRQVVQVNDYDSQTVW